MKGNNDSLWKLELQAITQSNPNLNVNADRKLTNKERIHLIVCSKLFTCAATICTLGGYYLYYLFCLEQAHDSPFVESTRYKGKYTFDKVEEEKDSYKELQRLNNSIVDVASNKVKSLKTSTPIQRKKDRLLVGFKSVIYSCISRILNAEDTLCLLVSKGNWGINSYDNLKINLEDAKGSKENKFREFIAEKMKQYSENSSDKLDFLDSLSTSNIKNTQDYYPIFLFFLSYLFFSVITLGLFPVYHLLIKDRRKDFANIFNHRKHASSAEFDEITEKLLGADGKLEYSLLLMERKNLPFRINAFSDAFRTIAFKFPQIRSKIVTFLMVITFGLFGVFILSKNVFDRDKLSIDYEDTTPTDYSKADRKFDKFKLFVLDLFRDIRVATRIAATKSSFINRSMESSLNIHAKEDKYLYRLMKAFSSYLYFWLFAMFVTFVSLIAVSSFLCRVDQWYSYAGFWFVVITWLTFFVLFTRHINLLFN